METFIADAHSLVWFICQSPQLSTKATDIFRKAERADVEILVPTIVLAELLYISERKKVPVEIGEVLKRIVEGGGFTIVPFGFDIFERMRNLPKELEIHDRIIAATAEINEARIITRDPAFQRVLEIEIVW